MTDFNPLDRNLPESDDALGVVHLRPKECKFSLQNGAVPGQNGPLKDSIAPNAGSTICNAVLPAEGVRFITKEGKKPTLMQNIS